MTGNQFDAIARLTRLRSGPAKEAARLVLVGGMTQTAAAAQAGCSRQSCTNTVARVRAAMALAREAVN